MADTATLDRDIDIEGFVDGVVAQVRERFWKLEHPLAKRILAGEMSKDDLRLWAGQYYLLTVHVADLINLLVLNAPDLDAKRDLIHNLDEEYGHPEGEGEPAHRDYFADFAASLGIDRDDVVAAPLLPGTRGMIEILRSLAGRSFVAGVVGIPITGEFFGPESSRAYLEAFRGTYQAPDVRYWDMHIEADEGHGETGRRMLLRFAEREAGRDEISDALDAALDAFWGFYDSILLYIDSPTRPTA